MVSKGNHPQMAELFRLVKYYKLPHGDIPCQDAVMRVELEVSKEHLASQRPWGKYHGEILYSKAVSGPSVFTKRTLLMFMDVMGLIWDSYGINMG